jgi:Leucine-rich repeat (LRR) protein
MNRLGIQVHNFAQMGELESLMLASNKLLALHSSVWGLTTLKRLDLGHNNLSDLPSGISSLTGLSVRAGTHASLPRGACSSIPHTNLSIAYELGLQARELRLGKAHSRPNLHVLHLVTGLRVGHGLQHAARRKHSVPCCSHFGVLCSRCCLLLCCVLQYLNVCHNFLTVLPAGLAYLTRLVDLDISLNTDMRELPTGLGALSLLTRLNASHMRLKQLPK